MQRFALFLLVLLTSVSASSKVILPRLISDNMVLQRDAVINIWGWATPAEKVIVSFNGKQYAAVANEKGEWKLGIAPQKAGGPFEMTINSIVLHNILIGDVWIASGQSNMELPMDRLKDYCPEEIASASNRMIRYFAVTTRYDFKTPQNDLEKGNWETVDSTSIRRMSALVYFFSKSLYQQYQIPLGIIKAAQGGSLAEAWLSESSVRRFPQESALLTKLQTNGYLNNIKQNDSLNSADWYTKLWVNDAGSRAIHWSDSSVDDTNWEDIKVPGHWKDQKKDFHGVAWYRKHIRVSDAMASKPAMLWLGNWVDRDSVFINGIFIGTTGYQYPPRKYPVPAGILKAGENIITVRVINYNGSGGSYEDKVYKLFNSIDTIHLSGTWKFRIGAELEEMPASTALYRLPAGLYNGMIHPLLPYTVKAVIWYQGESNADEYPEHYDYLFPELINSWRKEWNNKFPFLYVQLANYMKSSDTPQESNWARIRESQRQALKIPGTGMAVAIDVGEWNDIHPMNKKAVAERLSLLAQQIVYHKQGIVAAGPLYESSSISGNEIIIKFKNTGGGLKVAKNELSGFAISGKDKRFVWAKAIIRNNTVVVESPEVKQPAYVRYAWADNPIQANLINSEGLPAAAFSTER